MKSVKVPLKELNNTRKKLMEKQLMNMDYKIKTLFLYRLYHN